MTGKFEMILAITITGLLLIDSVLFPLSSISLAAPTETTQDYAMKWVYTGGLGHSGLDCPPLSVGPDGTLYIGLGNNSVAAMGPDLSVKWFCKTGNVPPVLSIGPDGMVYALSDSLFAISKSGDVKWSFNLEHINTDELEPPVIGPDGTIYVSPGHLYAINPDGTQKWNYSLADMISIYSPALSLDGTVYVASDDERIFSISVDGTENWNYSVDDTSRLYSNTLTPFTGSDGSVYFSSGTYVYALSSDGTMKWKYPLKDASIRQVKRNIIYIATDEFSETSLKEGSTIYALSSDGTLNWSYSASTSMMFAIRVDDAGYVFFSLIQNEVAGPPSVNMLSPDGKLVWVDVIPDITIVDNTIIGPNGTVYFTSSFGKIYCFETDTDSDGVPDSKDFLPTINNSQFWLVTILVLLVVLILVSRKFRPKKEGEKEEISPYIQKRSL